VTRSALPRIGLLALIWGSAFLWIKLADRGFSPVEVTLARLALGAAVLFAIVRIRREAIPRSGLLSVHIAVAALFANAVPYLLFAVAEQTVDSSTAGIINATTPLWTVVLALAVRHQKSVTSWQAAGLIVGFAGAVLIFTPWHTAGGLFSAGGLECLAASVSYAVSYIYMDRSWAAGESGRSCCPPASSPLPPSCSRSPWPLPALQRRMSPPGTSRRSRCWGSSGPGSRTC
jgi:drug/metabolite transporter (DMT)-like permease